MPAVYWTVAAPLALFSLYSGALKLIRTRERLLPMMAWVDTMATPAVRTLGAVELAGALGLVLPPATGIAPWLARTAAVGLVLLQAGATRVHLRRGDRRIGLNVTLLLAAALAAYLSTTPAAVAADSPPSPGSPPPAGARSGPAVLTQHPGRQVRGPGPVQVPGTAPGHRGQLLQAGEPHQVQADVVAQLRRPPRGRSARGRVRRAPRGVAHACVPFPRAWVSSHQGATEGSSGPAAHSGPGLAREPAALGRSMRGSSNRVAWIVREPSPRPRRMPREAGAPDHTDGGAHPTPPLSRRQPW